MTPGVAAPPAGREAAQEAVLRLLDDSGLDLVVFGSLPPRGRDVDVVVRDSDTAALADVLTTAGFLARGDTWARFHDRGADVVDVVPVSRWRLPAAEVDALFRDAPLLPGRGSLRRPAPHHELLVLARLLCSSPYVSAKRRARLAAVVDESAWTRAASLAPTWQVQRQLAALRRLRSGAPEQRRRWRPRHRPTWRPRVVALSGVDGAGKTTQVSALLVALDALGYDARPAWQPLASAVWLDRLARLVTRVLTWGRHAPTPPMTGTPSTRSGGSSRRLRESRRGIALVWSWLVVATTVAWQTRVWMADAVRGRVTVFDRYCLDSLARLTFQYGDTPEARLQARLLRGLSPRPVAAFFLDIDADVSTARKDDGWSREQIEEQVRLYRAAAARLPVSRINGARPTDEVAAEIAATVWSRLRER